jgi:hypothetical protein
MVNRVRGTIPVVYGAAQRSKPFLGRRLMLRTKALTRARKGRSARVPALTLTVVLGVTLSLYSEKGEAQNVTAQENGGVTIKPKAATLPGIKGPTTKGKITTTFKFHPEQTANTDLSKNVNQARVDPANPIIRVYTFTETHGTTGRV